MCSHRTRSADIGLSGGVDSAIVACIAADALGAEDAGEAFEALGDKVGLALDCGPGWMLQDAIRFARAVEKYNLMWLEDMLTGDYIPFVNADVYRELTQATSTPIHTGEQIYLRQNFKDLIEKQAVRVVGPDPCDVGGIAELKWIAEFADLSALLGVEVRLVQNEAGFIAAIKGEMKPMPEASPFPDFGEHEGAPRSGLASSCRDDLR